MLTTAWSSSKVNVFSTLSFGALIAPWNTATKIATNATLAEKIPITPPIIFKWIELLNLSRRTVCRTANDTCSYTIWPDNRYELLSKKVAASNTHREHRFEYRRIWIYIHLNLQILIYEKCRPASKYRFTWLPKHQSEYAQRTRQPYAAVCGTCVHHFLTYIRSKAKVSAKFNSNLANNFSQSRIGNEWQENGSFADSVSLNKRIPCHKTFLLSSVGGKAPIRLWFFFLSKWLFVNAFPLSQVVRVSNYHENLK